MRFGSNKNKDIEDDKKIVRSIQINTQLWNEFDKLTEKEFGHYKKSIIIEHLIRQYMLEKNRKDKNNPMYDV